MTTELCPRRSLPPHKMETIMEEKMTTTWYWIADWWNDIRQVEVVKETEKTVTIREPDWFDRTKTRDRRVTKNGSERYFPTWADAHAALLDRYEKRVESLRAQLVSANGDIGRVKGMKPPSSEPRE